MLARISASVQSFLRKYSSEAKMTSIMPFRWMRKSGCISQTILDTVLYLVRKPEKVDLHKRIFEVANENGFQLEAHKVTTQDGHILTLHRIKEDEASDDEGDKRPVVFLQHGLVCSSAVWLITPNGLAYALAKLGFDVWMGNFRGNTFSQDHLTLTTSDKEFWHFCWDQHGLIDLPTMINHVLEVTQNEKLHFVGHSMGTTAFFAMVSSMPEMNAKLVSAAALAPVTMMKFMNGAPRHCVTLAYYGIKLVNLFGIFFAHCPFKFNGYLGISSVILYFTGFRALDLDQPFMEDIFSFIPAGSSTFTVLHYIEAYMEKKFSSRNNNQEYQLDRITCPLTLWYSDKDWAACKDDVALIKAQIGEKVGLKEVPHDNFGHLDFLWDERVRRGLNYELMSDIVDNLY